MLPIRVSITFLAVGLVCGAPTPEPEVMNKGGIPYTISNPPGSTKGWIGRPGHYSTNFNTNVKGTVEHFDVYGEVRTKYSQVYWTRNNPIDLAPELVTRFDGKVMAITGYEIDVVTHMGPQPGSTTTDRKLGGFACYPECSGTDKSVPIYNAYNHHYFGWLVGKDAEVYDRREPVHLPNPSWTGVRDKTHEHLYPTNIVFKENPGGEFRKSYHGYPSGFAQLIHSPTQWVVEAMQIDTHNRNYDINDAVGFKPWFIPKVQQNNLTDLQSGLSPLIECPCSDRITKKSGYMSYMNESTWKFDGYNCMDQPRSDMLRRGDGTGRNVSNAACHLNTYRGGLQCCHDGFFLTDYEQNNLIPEEIDTYFLKWRYYFQEYVPPRASAPASHLHLHHWVFLIDAAVNDYEEDNAHYGSNSIGRITARLTGRAMGLEDVPKSFKGITPLVMTPHCHAPSCIREEFWNADTGEIICNVTAKYGSLEYGSLSQVFNEANYLAIPPCIFGDQPGLQKPFTLSPDTKITAIKYFNNTFRHLGQMAQWTGLMVYDTDPYFFI